MRAISPVSITVRKFVAGIVIAIIAASAISIRVSTILTLDLRDHKVSKGRKEYRESKDACASAAAQSVYLWYPSLIAVFYPT